MYLNCSSRKFSDLEFCEPTSHAREARGIPFIHWRELHSVGAKSGKIPMNLMLVDLLNHARTYFSTHPSP